MYGDKALRLLVLQPCTHAVASRNCLSYLRTPVSSCPSLPSLFLNQQPLTLCCGQLTW